MSHIGSARMGASGVPAERSGLRPEAPLDPALLPGPDDVAFYAEHGWWVSPKVIPDDVLDRAEEAVEDFYRTGGRALPRNIGFSDWTHSDGDDVLRNNEFVSLRSDRLAALSCLPVIGATAALLSGSAEIRLLDDQLVWKPPASEGSARAAVVGWHADKAYWGTCSSERLLTAWIPFHAVDARSGTLLVLDGSHRFDIGRDLRAFNDADLESLQTRLVDKGHEVRLVSIELARGQVSFHHGWTLHASGPNRSGAPRVALAVHLQDGENEYVPCFRPDGTPVHIADEALCRRREDGTPDFADPAVFPRIWPVN